MSVGSFENIFSQSIDFLFILLMGLPRWCSGKESACNAGDKRDVGSIPGSGRSPGVGNTAPVFLPRKFHGQRSLVSYSPRGHRESDMTAHGFLCCTKACKFD